MRRFSFGFLISSLVLVCAVFFSASPVFAQVDESAPADAKEPASEATSHFSLNEVLVHHLMDGPIFEWNIGGRKVRPADPEFHTDSYRRYTFKDDQGLYKWQGGLPMHITRRVAMMWLIGVLLLALFVPAARKIAKDYKKVNGRYAGMVESMVNYARHDLAESNMEHASLGFIAYIMTAFFFILFANLLGLFPPVGEIIDITGNLISGHPIDHHAGVGELPPAVIALWPGITVTGDIAVTLSLSLITVILIYAAGFKYQGVQFIWHSVPGGVPWILFPIMWPIEFIIGPLAKGFALMIRLLANMTAGHVIILVLVGFIFQYRSWGLVPVSMLGMGAIYVLEILVAVLQAFIFSLLSAIFIGLSMHRH